MKISIEGLSEEVMHDTFPRPDTEITFQEVHDEYVKVSFDCPTRVEYLIDINDLKKVLEVL